MGFCSGYDYFGPDWASSWPSGSNAGWGVAMSGLFNRQAQDRGFPGGFYEIAAYDRELTDEEETTVRSYMISKWGFGL